MYALVREHSWPLALLTSAAVSLCVCVDVLQYSAPVASPLSPAAHRGLETAGSMAGCVLLTAWQLWLLLSQRVPDSDHWRDLRQHVLKLGFGVAASALTLLVEAEGSSSWRPACRLAQGGLGSIVLIYAYVLVVAALAGPQKAFALTTVTMSAALAAVGGPLLGAWAMDRVGFRGWHSVLSCFALLTNVLLVLVYHWLPTDPADEIVLPGSLGERTPLLSQLGPDSPQLIMPAHVADLDPTPPPGLARWSLVSRIGSNPAFAVLLVLGPAAMVKAAVEAVLPTFGQLQGYSPQGITALYGVEMGSFVVGLVVTALAWPRASRRQRAALTAAAAVVVAAVACGLLYSFGLPDAAADLSPAVFAWVTALNGARHYLFYAMLAHAGLFLGCVHASSALYLGDLLTALEDGWGGAASKQVAIGLFATVWRLGSACGFAACGSYAQWRDEQQVLTTLGSLVLAATAGFALAAVPDREGFSGILAEKRAYV